ncbi:unnamed protein product [Rhizoctonia solani]|uniref:Uncharacterized protein n=1 Tax=Rhizoctonia solani TaxID=456999 RepID=A0A8H3BN74_9AGAM|nr:unnamed protein product [Rhizoctonia solani]
MWDTSLPLRLLSFQSWYPLGLSRNTSDGILANPNNDVCDWLPVGLANTRIDIIRLLFMAPIYAGITLAAYVSPTNGMWLFLLRDVYEAIALTSFLSLLLEYVAGPSHAEPEPNRNRINESSGTESLDRRTMVHKVFYQLPMRTDARNTHKPLAWIFPFGFVRARPRDGLVYLRVVQWGVWQYCFVRPGSALAAVILQQRNLYCESSWSWRSGHVYLVTIVSVSAVVAMYCLIQLYTTIHQELKPYKPLSKLLSITALIFLTFWQSALLSGIASRNLIPDTEYLTSDDITLGFSALLQTFEMMCFAVVHVKLFSYLGYKRIAQELRTLDPDMPPLLLARPDSGSELPSSARRQFLNLIYTFRFRLVWPRGASREADECRRQERFKQDRERSFMRTGGYKGLPQEEDKYPRGVAGLMYSPLPTPEDEPRSTSLELGDVIVPRVEYTPDGRGTCFPPEAYLVVSPPREAYVPAPPPRGAYVPAHGPAWSGDGIITPPRTPVFVSPASYRPVESPPVSSSNPPTSRNVNIPASPSLPTSPTKIPAPQSQASRRIASVYVGGPRGQEFISRTGGASPVLPISPGSPRSDESLASLWPGGTPVSPRPAGTPVSLWPSETPVSSRPIGIPVSPRTPVSPHPIGTPVSTRPAAPLSAGPFAPRYQGAYAPAPGIPSVPQAKGISGTHISPTSAHMLAQTSPLFQQSFSADVQANYPRSPVSSPLLRVSEESAPRTSSETQPTQRNSGFTLPHWASGTPTHSQWPSGTTHSQWPSSRRTSANTIPLPPPSPTRGRRISIPEEVEPPSSSRDDSLLGRVFSNASRTRESESGGARSSILSSSNGSEEDAVHPVRSVSMRSAAPVLVRFSDRHDSISSPSLVSSSFRARRESDPSTPSSASSRPSPSVTAPYAALPSPPEVARPLRRMSANLRLRVPRGPRSQPRSVTIPAPLSPTRYPHSPWRPTATRSSGLGHVSSVHATVSHWNPLQPPSTSSSEPRLTAPEYTAMSSLSSLSNSDDRYPTAS